MSLLQKIKEVEDEMARTQKNKATAAHLGLLKARLSKYKRELIETDSRRGGGGGGTVGHQFEVAKSGDARVGLIGFPSVGKSTMLSKLTSTESEVASYEFTTLTAIPGVIHYKGSKIQLVDLPGIIEGAKDGKGRGRQIIGVGRTCDMILIVLDGMKDLRIRDKIEDELHGFGIRVNKQPPNIKFQKKDKGGVSFTATCAVSNVDEEQVKTILAEYRIHNAEVCFKGDYEIDDLIDVVEGNRIYMPVLYVINKVDQLSMEELNIMGKLENTVFISAHHEWGLDDLLSEIWERLKLVRVYTKPKGQIPDYDSPVILKEGRCKIEHFCMKIHKHMVKSLKYANVWGMSVKHQPQKVGKDHVLQDEDVVQIVKQKGK